MLSKDKKYRSGHRYVIYLSKSRSILALVACLITITFTFYAIAGGMVIYVRDGMSAWRIFEWFTTISNTITCFGACMITPFAVEGIRRKHFAFPRWISMFFYSGMVCTTLTMVMAIFLISWTDPELAFGGYNSYLHFVCPIMVIISFFMVESGFIYTAREALLAAVPVIVYTAIYAFEVVVIGEENGGWEDMYRVREHVPVPVAMIGVPLVAVGLSFLIRLANNKKVVWRNDRLMSNLWPKDVSPTEINVEVFGLGRYMGKHADVEFVVLYLDILHDIAEKYNMKPENLVRPYIKGFFDSFKEKQEGLGNLHSDRKNIKG